LRHVILYQVKVRYGNFKSRFFSPAKPGGGKNEWTRECMISATIETSGIRFGTVRYSILGIKHQDLCQVTYTSRVRKTSIFPHPHTKANKKKKHTATPYQLLGKGFLVVTAPFINSGIANFQRATFQIKTPEPPSSKLMSHNAGSRSSIS